MSQSGIQYEARLDGRLLTTSKTPLLAAARVLLEEGHDPDEMLEMMRHGSERVDLRAPLGIAAKLAVNEDRAAFVPYRQFQG